MCNHFPILDTDTDDSSGASEASSSDLEARLEQLETMAINTAVSEAVDEALDSAINTAVSEALDSPTPSDDLVLVSDEEEEGHEDRCEWGFIYCVFLT